jgi:hypothetical protein
MEFKISDEFIEKMGVMKMKKWPKELIIGTSSSSL